MRHVCTMLLMSVFFASHAQNKTDSPKNNNQFEDKSLPAPQGLLHPFVP